MEVTMNNNPLQPGPNPVCYFVAFKVFQNMRFGILSPLTFKNDEFEEYLGGIAQNKRLSRVFRKSDNGRTWYKDIDCLDYSVGLVYDFAKKEIKDGYGGIWGGLVYLIGNDGEIYPSTSVGIKNLTGFRGGNNHTVKALKVTGYSRTDRDKSLIVANADALPSEWHGDYEMHPADDSLDKDVIDVIAMPDIETTEKVIDWEQRRFDLVRALFVKYACSPDNLPYLLNDIIPQADALINELKKGIEK